MCYPNDGDGDEGTILRAIEEIRSAALVMY